MKNVLGQPLLCSVMFVDVRWDHDLSVAGLCILVPTCSFPRGRI